MAMRSRVIDLPARPQLKNPRHGGKCDVVGILSQSSAIQALIEKSQLEPLPELHRIECGLIYWLALVQIKYHDTTRDAWTALAQAINIGMILAEDGIAPEYLELFFAAQEAIFRACYRGEWNGAYRLDGPGLAVVTEALEVHDAQLEHARRGEVTRAERVMLERQDKGDFVIADRAAA